MLKPCTNLNCHSPFQDARYGKGMRQHTVGTKHHERRCTVCGLKTLINMPQAMKEEKAKVKAKGKPVKEEKKNGRGRR